MFAPAAIPPMTAVMVALVDMAMSFILVGLLTVYGLFAVRDSRGRKTRMLHLLTFSAATIYATASLLHLDRATWTWYLTGSALGHYPLLVWWIFTLISTKQHPSNRTILLHVLGLNFCLFASHSLNLLHHGRSVDYFVIVRTVSTFFYGVQVAQIIIKAIWFNNDDAARVRTLPLQKFIIVMFLLIPIVDVGLRLQFAEGHLLSNILQKAAIIAGTMLYLYMTLTYSTARISKLVSVPDDKHAAVILRLKRLFHDEYIYRDPALCMKILAERCGAPEYLVRQAIAEGFEAKNVNALINRFRVDEARALLHSKDSAHRTIASIADEVGFASLSSFNAAFKKVTGTTPSKYRNGSKNFLAA